MRHVASPQFWHSYRKLPATVRKLDRNNFKLLKDDMKHPSLRLNKWVLSGQFVSAMVTGLWVWKDSKRWSGSGLDPIQTTIE